MKSQQQWLVKARLVKIDGIAEGKSIKLLWKRENGQEKKLEVEFVSALQQRRRLFPHVLRNNRSDEKH